MPSCSPHSDPFNLFSIILLLISFTPNHCLSHFFCIPFHFLNFFFLNIFWCVLYLSCFVFWPHQMDESWWGVFVCSCLYLDLFLQSRPVALMYFYLPPPVLSSLLTSYSFSFSSAAIQYLGFSPRYPSGFSFPLLRLSSG